MATSGTTVAIPIDDIVVGKNISNIRSYLNEEEVKELADAIHKDGLLHPLTVMEIEDDAGNAAFELVAGRRRLAAIRHIREFIDATAFDDGVPTIVYEGTLVEAEYVNASENIDRKDVDDVDVSAWLHQRVRNGITQTELADKLHRSIEWVNFRVLFHERSTDELKKLLREGLIPFTAAYMLSKNLSAEEQDKRCKRARKFGEKITVEEAERAGDPNKTKRPGRKEIKAMSAKASSAEGDFARGVSFALRWIAGENTEEELDEMLHQG